MVTWETAADWDANADEKGVVHANLSNTDFSNAATVRHALPVGPTVNITDGLVGWWTLSSVLDTEPDLSGNGYDGTHYSTTQNVAGVGGLTASAFVDADNSRVEIGDYADLKSNLSEITVSVWFTPVDASNYGVVVGARGGGTPDSWNISYDSNGEARWVIYDGSRNYTYGAVGPKNEFVNAVGRWNGTDMELFVDGVSQDTNTASEIASSSNQVQIGTDEDLNTNGGRIAEVRIYNRALSNSEIQTLYEWGSTTGLTDPRFHDGADSGAVARYALDGDATDSWGSNDGTNNGVSFVSDAIRGQAGEFVESESDYVSTPLTNSYNPITVSFWTKYDGQSDQGSIVRGYNGSDRAFVIQVDGGNGDKLTWYTYDGSILSSLNPSEAVVPVGSWCHFVCQYDGSDYVIYKNGVEVVRDTNGYQQSSNVSWNIGARNNSGTADRFYNGQIDDVRVFDRALDPWEIHQLYRWGTRGRDLRQFTVQAPL